MAVIPLNNQIVHLAYTISEADDHSIPVLLLQLKDILDNTTKVREKILLVDEIWKYEFPSMILSALQLDPSTTSIPWINMCQLSLLLVDCCAAYTSNKKWLRENFLNYATIVILQNISKLIVDYNKAERIFKENLLKNLATIISSITMLLQHFTSLASSVLSSKHVMQLLMVENSKVTSLSLSFLQTIIQLDRGLFDHISVSRIHSICDELTFKITSTTDVQTARKKELHKALTSKIRTSVSLLLLMIDLHQPLLDLFSSKRYRGFKLYLNKWMNNGFNADVNRFIKVLEARSEEQKIIREHESAAIMIQSFYRGYCDRKKLRRALEAIRMFQRLCRRKRNERMMQTEKITMEKMRKDIIETKRRKNFVGSRTKQLQVIEKIPARTVTKFLDNLQHESAKKIQALWRGHTTRRMFLSNLPWLRIERAAIVIQRMVRKWLKHKRRKRSAVLDLIPAGLTDARKVELQNVIVKIREKFNEKGTSQDVDVKNQTAPINDEQLHHKHEKAFRMLNNHVISLRQIRRRDDHRKALIAQLSVQSELMSTSPSLQYVGKEDVTQYSSYSTPIVMAARQKHLESIYNLKKPWWERLNNDDVTSVVSSNGIDYESKYLQDHEKQF